MWNVRRFIYCDWIYLDRIVGFVSTNIDFVSHTVELLVGVMLKSKTSKCHGYISCEHIVSFLFLFLYLSIQFNSMRFILIICPSFGVPVFAHCTPSDSSLCRQRTNERTSEKKTFSRREFIAIANSNAVQQLLNQ